jgi:hypothetical protein
MVRQATILSALSAGEWLNQGRDARESPSPKSCPVRYGPPVCFTSVLYGNRRYLGDSRGQTTKGGSMVPLQR